MDEKERRGEQQRTDIAGLPISGDPNEAEPEDVSIHQILRDDHKRMKGLFRQMEAIDLRAREMKHEVAEVLFDEILTHSRLEQEFYYPQLQSFLDESGRSLAVESVAEHQDIDATIAELRRRDPDDSLFDEKLEDLMASLELHFDREERELMLAAEKVLGAEKLLELGREFRIKREEIGIHSVAAGNKGRAA